MMPFMSRYKLSNSGICKEENMVRFARMVPPRQTTRLIFFDDFAEAGISLAEPPIELRDTHFESANVSLLF